MSISQLFVFIKKKRHSESQQSAKQSAFHQITSFQRDVSVCQRLKIFHASNIESSVHVKEAATEETSLNGLNKSHQNSPNYFPKLSKIFRSEANIYMDTFGLKICSQET